MTTTMALSWKLMMRICLHPKAERNQVRRTSKERLMLSTLARITKKMKKTRKL
jgi:hypothetical protein